MTVTIVGAQMGDEGKGGVVDLYGDEADVVARYQGGDNAGHTVVVDGDEFKLSLVPSGVVRGTVGLLGNGCVVNPATLFDEVDALRERGLDPDVRVARRAHVILPYHRVLDGAEEAAKSDSDLEAGTTGRGIGPTYEDKAARRGIRVGDLLDPAGLRERIEYVVPLKRTLASEVFGVDPDDPDHAEAFDAEALYEQYRAYGRRLDEEGMTVDAGRFLADRVAAGDEILLEGAQGTGLDIDHGSYPYVTSSNPTAGGAATGTGLGVTTVGRGEVVGVVKAYFSRVGTGPMPTELDGDLAETIRERGGEYGTVTGRPRRVGWFDLPLVRHAARANGYTGLVVNHVDTLAGFDELQVCVAYDLDGERVETVPSETDRWARCEPRYRRFEGWPGADWGAVAEEGYDALPANAREYLDFLAGEVDTPIYAVGVGPGREETVVREHPLE
ncbi:adenylosuccinate synthase [Halobacteriales archaeon QS_8_69_26]|nr:MAG: adenylosuccinate synthase [Halobacteriales archaeon QS_8_69_26]